MIVPMLPRAPIIVVAALAGMSAAARGHPAPKVENIDPLWHMKSPPQLMVPEGTANIALGRPVTLSGQGALIGEPAMVTDGDKDYGRDHAVELAGGPQWAQVDLGEGATIQAIALWLGDLVQTPRAYYDVIVRLSDDAHFVSGVTTLFNNDHDDSSGLGKGTDYAYIDDYKGKLIDARGVRARYVRVHANGGTAGPESHFTEIEVWGTRGKPGAKKVPLMLALPRPMFR